MTHVRAREVVASPERRRFLTGLLVGLVVLAPAILAVPAAAATTPAATDQVLPVVVQVTKVSPQVLAPGDDLKVSVTLTNAGDDEIATPRVFVNLDRNGFISRSSLDAWRDAGPYGAAGIAIGMVDLEGPLAAGATASTTISIPAASIGLSSLTWSWGARGLAVEVVDAADPTRIRLGLVRTFTVWFPPQDVTPTTLSIVVPLTGPAPTTDQATSVAAQTASGGRLDEILRATASHPDVTWAVDPMLLTVASAGRGATGSPWADEILQAAEGREIQLIPWGDADVTALAHARATGLAQLAEERSIQAAADLGLDATDVFAWPGVATTDLETARFASSQGTRAVVVAPGELLPPNVLTYTPSALTTALTGSTDVDLLVPDAELSRSLTTGMTLEEEAAGGSAQLTGATAAADLLAELAIITRERPSDGRHLLAALPRGWTPVASIASAQLSALEDAPWVTLAPVSELAGASDSGVDRGSLAQRETRSTEVSADELDATATAVAERVAVAVMGADPQALSGDPDEDRLAPAALAWRSDPSGRATSIARVVAATALLRSAVSVPPTQTVNLISTSGDLPLRVNNALDQDVTVLVRLRPTNRRLVADTPVEVVIPARGETTVQIPVRGVQSADVETLVEITTTEGVVIDDTTRLTVKVRAEWENIGTAAFGGVLALGLVIGLVRTARRAHGTRADRAAAAAGVGVPEDLAQAGS